MRAHRHAAVEVILEADWLAALVDLPCGGFGHDASAAWGGGSIVEVFGVSWDCLIPECGVSPAPVDPGRTFQPLLLGEEGALHGQVLYVGPEGADRHPAAVEDRRRA